MKFLSNVHKTILGKGGRKPKNRPYAEWSIPTEGLLHPAGRMIEAKRGIDPEAKQGLSGTYLLIFCIKSCIMEAMSGVKLKITAFSRKKDTAGKAVSAGIE